MNSEMSGSRNSIDWMLNPSPSSKRVATDQANDYPYHQPAGHSRSSSDRFELAASSSSSASSSSATGSYIPAGYSMSYRRQTTYPPQPANDNLQDNCSSYSPQLSPRQRNQSLEYSPHARTIYSPGINQYSSGSQSYNDYQHNERVSVRLATQNSTSYLSPPPQQLSLSNYGSRPNQAVQERQYARSSNSHSPPPLHLRRKRSQDNISRPAKKAKTTAKPRLAKDRDNDGSPPVQAVKKAKKRTGAPGRAIQGDTMPKISYIQIMSDKGKGKALNTRNTLPVDAMTHTEMQTTRCMSAKYKDLDVPRCVSCTRRWAGDICRFQNIRFLLRNSKNEYCGVSFLDKHVEPPLHFPKRWNVEFRPEHLQRTKTTIAQALLPALRLESEHQQHDDLIHRQRENGVRTTCDTCMTSIFSASWMCRLCGREACAECYEQVKRLTVIPANATAEDKAVLKNKKDKHAHGNPFFLSCTKRNDHSAEDFSPMSRFSPELLTEAIRDMEELLEAQKDPVLCRIIDEHPQPVQEAGPSSAILIDAKVCPVQTTSLDILRVAHTDLTDDIFRPCWGNGTPLVVTGLLSKFKLQWSPEYFSAKYNKVSCLILQCQTEKSKQSTVGSFFDMFADAQNRKDSDVWKLKDWPPSTDFKTEYPDLFEDFSNAVPVPNYVRRDGVLNIASHFPGNAVPPDIGPKMYNAMGSSTAPGSKGSTRLHMDMADALNIMTYAGPMKDGTPGCAAWDLYPAADSDKIRQYLKKHGAKKAREAVVSPKPVSADGQVEAASPAAVGTDPIHSQLFYVDEAMRKELFDEYGVKSWRIYQYPGEAVFIPAGCAHQVCNLADCIKVAIDFVSPENVERCAKLTQEFREQNHSQVWKEDVLQLRSMMWYAWLSCEGQEKQLEA